MKDKKKYIAFRAKGSGTIELDDKKFFVNEGDVVLIEDGVSPEYTQVHVVVTLFVCLMVGESFENRYYI